MSNAHVTQAAIADFFDAVPATIQYASGDTIKLDGIQDPIVRLGAGTFKIEPLAIGRSFILITTGAVTITNIAGTELLRVATGITAWVKALTTTTLSVTAAYGGTVGIGIVPIPLTQWRETGTDDTLAVVPGAGLGAGGVLGTDSTPALEYVNGDTDSSLRILYAANGVQPIVAQVMLPIDMDTTQPILFYVAGVMGGATDTPVLSLDTYIKDSGGTTTAKIEDNTSAFSDAVDLQFATIAASDIPDVSITTPQWMTIEVTPGAHTNDTLAIFGTYLQYTKKAG